ncbi:MAG: alpha/beta fold hydrolase [Pseudomonadales bacterium]
MSSLGGLGRVALVVLLFGCATNASTPSSELDAMAAALLAEHRIPGLALIVLQGDKYVHARGYGLQDAHVLDAVSPETVFQLGSISKQFLAALVLRYAEQGRLSLEDRATQHLPEFSRLPPDLRVHHLLSHTSGIREPFSMPEYQNGIEDLSGSADALLSLLLGAPVDFPPGARWSYSNANYMLLALIVERLAEVPYERALAEELFVPLELASLRHCSPLPQGRDEARGHVLRDDRVTSAPPENMNWIRGDGGLCGSALDLARWSRLLATEQVVSARSYQLMSAPAQLADGSRVDYGLGLSLVSLDGRRKISHNGAMLGFSASAAYYPDNDLTVVVLTNRGDVRTEAIERTVARRLLHLPVPDLRGRDLSAQARAAYLGRYDIGVFSVQVVERGQQLWLEAPPPGPTTPLRYLGDGVFAGDRDPDAVGVTFDHVDGRAARLRLYMGGMHWYGQRLAEIDESSRERDMQALKRAELDGIELHYIETGAAQGQPVVLVHGSLADYSYWQQSRQIEQLAERYRVIAYSRRYNYPNDNAPLGDHSAAVEAADLARLLESLALGPVHLVGHSYGAYTALLLTLEHPELVRSLVLAEPPVLPWLPDIPGGEGVMESFMAESWQPMGRTFRKQGDEAGLERTAQWYFGVPFAEVDAQWQTLFSRNVREWRAIATSPSAFPPIDASRLGALSKPVLLLSGGRNAGGYNDLIDGYLERLLPNAQRVVIADASHEMFLDHPEKSARAMLDFLARQGDGDGDGEGHEVPGR